MPKTADQPGLPAFPPALPPAGRRTRAAGTAAVATLAMTFACLPTPSSAGAPGRAAVSQRLERFASRDGRCRFAHPRVAVASIAIAAAERIERALTASISASPGRLDRAATHAARIAECRRELAGFGSGAGRGPTYFEERTVRVALDGRGLLSVALESFENYVPSAHPTTTYAMYCFDLGDGRGYTVNAMFKPHSDARRRSLILADLRRQDRASGTDPNSASLASIYPRTGSALGPHDVLVRRDGIDFYNVFDFHAAAGVVVHISARALRASGIIAPNGPLRIFL